MHVTRYAYAFCYQNVLYANCNQEIRSVNDALVYLKSRSEKLFPLTRRCFQLLIQSVYGWVMGGLWVVYSLFMGGHLTDLKILLFARKIHVRKLGKSFHITNCKTSIRIDLV
jgi:hypothetical protein